MAEAVINNLSDRAKSDELAALVRTEVLRQVETTRAELLRELEAVRAGLSREVEAVRARTADDKATLVVFSGDLDKMLAAFIIATGAAAMGLETSMFFTFWGLSGLRKTDAKRNPKDIYERLLALMTPNSAASLGVSKGNFFGAGAAMLRQVMKKREISSLEELIELARQSGVKFTACAMSMEVLGMSREELIDGVELGGVAAYLGDAARSRVTLFI